jgi:hypothetical protein
LFLTSATSTFPFQRNIIGGNTEYDLSIGSNSDEERKHREFSPLCISISCVEQMTPKTIAASAPFHIITRGTRTLWARVENNGGGEHSTGASANANLSATSAADAASAADDIENANTSNTNTTNKNQQYQQRHWYNL